MEREYLASDDSRGQDEQIIMEMPLPELENGKSAVISRLEGGSEFVNKLSSLNIRAGKIIRKVIMQPLKGPVIIEIDSRHIAVGQGLSLIHI